MNNDDTIRLSKWTHLFRAGGYIALYHALVMEVIFLEERFSEVVRKLQLGTILEHLIGTHDGDRAELETIVAELIRVGIAVSVDTDDMKLLQEMRTIHIGPPGLETMYLLVTDSCNLQCRYCFINQNMPAGYTRTNMTIETAKEAVDMFFANLAGNPPVYSKLKKTILFYGGEPLINFVLIQQVVEYIERAYGNEVVAMGDGFQMSIVTNGTLVDKEMATFIASRNLINITVSIDGNDRVHDSKRCRNNGRGSFAGAIKGYQILRDAGKRVSVSCTIDDHNIDHLPDLLELQKRHGFASVNLNPLEDTAQRAVSLDYMRIVSRRIIEYFELARQTGIYEDRMMRKVRAFVSQRIHAYDCHALGSQLVVSPDGQLGVCHEGLGIKKFFFSRVSKNFDFHTSQIVAEWKLRTPLNMPQCYNCPAIGICGGGCAYSACLRNGSIWSVDDRFCVHSLTTLEWLIWDLFKSL